MRRMVYLFKLSVNTESSEGYRVATFFASSLTPTLSAKNSWNYRESYIANIEMSVQAWLVNSSYVRCASHQ